MILLTLRDLRHRLVRFVVVVLLGAVVLSLLFVMTLSMNAVAIRLVRRFREVYE